MRPGGRRVHAFCQAAGNRESSPSEGTRELPGVVPATLAGAAAADYRHLRMPEQVRIAGDEQDGRRVHAAAQEAGIVVTVPADEVVARRSLQPAQVGGQHAQVRGLQRSAGARTDTRTAPGVRPGIERDARPASVVEQQAQCGAGSAAPDQDE